MFICPTKPKVELWSAFWVSPPRLVRVKFLFSLGWRKVEQYIHYFCPPLPELFTVLQSQNIGGTLKLREITCMTKKMGSFDGLFICREIGGAKLCKHEEKGTVSVFLLYTPKTKGAFNSNCLGRAPMVYLFTGV